MATPDDRTDDRGALDAIDGAPENPDGGTPDEFSAAFDESVGVGDKADQSAAADPPMKSAEEIAAEGQTPPTPAEPVTKTEEKPVVDPSLQQPGETDEKFEQRYKTLQGIHKHDAEAWKAREAELLAQVEEAKKPKTPEEKPSPTPAEETAAQAFIDSLTLEQQEQLKAYDDEFDVVSKMEGIKRGVELGKLRKEIDVWKKEVFSKLDAQGAKIAPVVKMAEENELDSHFDLIREGYTREDGIVVPGHGDFEKYRDDGSLMAWIKARPKYLQPALMETYSKGAAEDVVDLYNDFKRDSNIPLTQPATGNVIPMNQRKAARKQALLAVPTRRTAVQTGRAIADDFEGAFDEALNKAGG